MGNLALAQLPKGDGSSRGNIQGINAVLHGYAHDMVGGSDRLSRQAVALGAHNQGQAGFFFQLGVIERDGIVAQRHRGGAETQLVQVRSHGLVDPGPGNEEYRPHRHANGTAVQWVARRGRQQYRIDAQSGCRAEDGPDVVCVGHAIDDHHTAGIAAHVGHRHGHGAPHGTQHTPREGVAREGRQQVALARIDRNIAAALDDACSVTRDVPPLAQQRQRLVARIQGDMDHLGALGNEDALIRFQPVAQLRLGKRPEDIYPRMLQRCYLNYRHDGCVISLDGGGAGALDGAHLALELQRALDVAQHDGAGPGARDLDGAVIADAAPQVLLDQDALHLADDNLVGMAVNPAVAVEKALVAHKDGRREVADEAAQAQIGPLAEFGLIQDGLALSDDLADFHNLS